MHKHLVTLFAVVVIALTTASAHAQTLPESPTLGVRYFRLSSATDAEYKGDAKALASSLRIALDNSKGFKQIVTLDDEQVEQLTKLIADSKKGGFNRQLPGNLAEPPDAYVFPELLRAGAVERDMFARIEVTYTVELGASAVDPVTRAILFSDKVTISEKRNKTDSRGGAKNVYEDLVSKAVDRLSAKLAAFFLKRGRVLRVAEDNQTLYINLGTRHGIRAGDRFTVHKVGHEGAQAVGDTAEEEGLAEFDLDAKATVEVTEVRENAAKAKINGTGKGVQKGDAVRWVKPQ
ncbi:MAG TPA: FlgT C-terminal domain-containing protein [Blastocatellia bacterium]|nr:FlgT C-terminal domain-containing protein [Blastocatellia bacterium]